MNAARLLLTVLGALMISSSAGGANADSYKKDVILFYDAFAMKQPALLDRILDAQWVDIPPAPDQPPGPAGGKQLLAELTRAFPDLDIKVEEVLRDGNKVIVRSTLSGTQRETFLGIPAKGRTMSIQAVDIHEFRDGKIVRTWHTEDWMTGLHQLGAFDK